MLPLDPIAVALTLAACATALLSGVAGMGGGTLLMAAMLALGLAPTEAVPLFALVQLVSNTSRTLAYAPAVYWPAAGWFLLAAIPATALALPLLAGLPDGLVQVLLAALVLLSLTPGRAGRAPLAPVPSFLLAGALNGGFGAVVGATGLFVGRLFLRPEWPKERIIATLALTQVLGHGLRVLAFGLLGLGAVQRPGLALALCLAVMLGTLAGRRLNAALDEARYRAGVQALLIGLAAYLVWDGARRLWS